MNTHTISAEKYNFSRICHCVIVTIGLIFNDIRRHDFAVIADVVARLDGVELAGDLVVELVGLLFLAVEHAALQGQRELLEARHADDFGLHGGQSGGGDLVHVPAAGRG